MDVRQHPALVISTPMTRHPPPQPIAGVFCYVAAHLLRTATRDTLLGSMVSDGEYWGRVGLVGVERHRQNVVFTKPSWQRWHQQL